MFIYIYRVLYTRIWIDYFIGPDRIAIYRIQISVLLLQTFHFIDDKYNITKLQIFDMSVLNDDYRLVLIKTFSCSDFHHRLHFSVGNVEKTIFSSTKWKWPEKFKSTGILWTNPIFTILNFVISKIIVTIYIVINIVHTYNFAFLIDRFQVNYLIYIFTV